MLKKLFIIDGAAGTGKTDLVEYVKNKYHNANIVCKYTTRPIRSEDQQNNLDLIFVSEKEFTEKNLKKENVYLYGGNLYGFDENELEISLEQSEITLIIIRNIHVIKRLQKKYRYKTIVIPLYIYTDRSLLEKRLIDDGYSQDKIDFRLKRFGACWEDYLENDYLGTPIIINNSNKVDFHCKINQLFASEMIREETEYVYINPSVKFKMINALIGYKEEIQNKLKKYPYEKNIFLMMKFRNDNKEIYEYIKCQTAHCGRRKPHFDFGRNACPIVPYRHLPQTLCGMTADCRSLV